MKSLRNLVGGLMATASLAVGLSGCMSVPETVQLPIQEFSRMDQIHMSYLGKIPYYLKSTREKVSEGLPTKDAFYERYGGVEKAKQGIVNSLNDLEIPREDVEGLSFVVSDDVPKGEGLAYYQDGKILFSGRYLEYLIHGRSLAFAVGEHYVTNLSEEERKEFFDLIREDQRGLFKLDEKINPSRINYLLLEELSRFKTVRGAFNYSGPFKFVSSCSDVNRLTRYEELMGNDPNVILTEDNLQDIAVDAYAWFHRNPKIEWTPLAQKDPKWFVLEGAKREYDLFFGNVLVKGNNEISPEDISLVIEDN